MASKGNQALLKSLPKLPPDIRITIVSTEWNEAITDELVKGATKVLKQAGYMPQVYKVPGAVEVPYLIRQIHDNQIPKPDAFIAFGCVIKGDTPHFDYVCKSITDGITQLNLSLLSPVIFGVLTVNTEQQAKERIGGIHGHKGEEAAITALKMIALKHSI
ncbi:MAG TPA: 6,7-dimethyl-8-ribityllumazine synthase [Phnomibacter sp.]|nr:6,7-dimethyl-8-ribityllumazine synthase [Phnomibacter sp.]